MSLIVRLHRRFDDIGDALTDVLLSLNATPSDKDPGFQPVSTE